MIQLPPPALGFCLHHPTAPISQSNQMEKSKQHVQSSLSVWRSYRNILVNGSLMPNKAWWGTQSIAGFSCVQGKARSILIPPENKAIYYRSFRQNKTTQYSTVCMTISRCSKHQLVFQPVPCGFSFGSIWTNLICTLVFCSLGH